VPLLDQAGLRERIERLAAIERESASPGEREAAELIAAELRETGARVRVEEERVHGTYWWPVGLLSALAVVAALVRSRAAGAIGGAIATVGMADEISAGGLVFRRLLPKRTTVNVAAEIGDHQAERTLVFVAHHDAAHAGLVFHPEPPRAIARKFPRWHARQTTTPPTMWGAAGAPAMVTLGGVTGLRPLRRLGAAIATGYAAAMADIGARKAVPGANDNLTGVVVLLSLAHALADDPPPPGTKVLLLSTGSEESFSEGMEAFLRRNGANLPPDRTHVICVDTVGSPKLLLLEFEGMLRSRPYPDDLRELIHRCCEEEEVDVHPRLGFRNATDGGIALKHGYPAAMIGSIDEYGIPTNYHWPTDTPDRVHYDTVAGAARVCLTLLRKLGSEPARPERSGLSATASA
jgi:hypothetical protein